MAAHLAHKIPWESLCPILVERSATEWRHAPSLAQTKQIAHAGRVLAKTLQEFKSTSKTTPSELAVLDPKTWEIDYEISMGASTGYYDSLVWGYVELNLLLADPLRLEPLLRGHRGQCTFIMSTLLGHHDGGHPEAIADKLAPAFDDNGQRLKPLTAEVMQTLRDHTALLFRCMYLMTGENRLLDEEFMVGKLHDYFGCYAPME